MTQAFLLPEADADRFLNMALDEAIWRWVCAGCADAVARLYGWSDAPVLSVGYFQSVLQEDCQRQLARVAGRFVRRPTGGGAIRHEHQITFALALRCRQRGLRGIAPLVHRAVARELSLAGIPVQMGGVGADDSAFYCFDRPDRYALCCYGRRVLGSAQRRRGQVVLIHGVLDPAGVMPRELAKVALVRAFEAVWGSRLPTRAPDERLLAVARELARTRYRTRRWNHRGRGHPADSDRLVPTRQMR